MYVGCALGYFHCVIFSYVSEALRQSKLAFRKYIDKRLLLSLYVNSILYWIKNAKAYRLQSKSQHLNQVMLK